MFWLLVAAVITASLVGVLRFFRSEKRAEIVVVVDAPVPDDPEGAATLVSDRVLSHLGASAGVRVETVIEGA